MGPQTTLGSFATDNLSAKIEAIYTLGDIDEQCEPDRMTFVRLASNISIHTLNEVVRPIETDRLRIVWPDAWPIVQQTAIPLRQHFGENSAELTLWRRGQQAKQLLDASALIATGNLPIDQQHALARQLQNTACRLGASSDLSPIDQLIAAYTALDAQLDDAVQTQATDAPACLPQLVALYEEIDTAILVITDAAQLRTVDWHAVRAEFKQFNNLLITTTKQLNLLAHSELAVALGIGRYRLQQGQDLTSHLVVPLRAYLINAAQTIMAIYADSLPRGVMNSAETDFGKLIHDVQNQLLKAQFQYELLNMIFDISEQAAPRLHSDRTLPFRKRIDALVAHLQDWVALYTALLNANL